MRFARLPVVSVTEADGYFHRYDTISCEIRKKILYNGIRVSAKRFLAVLKEIRDRNVRRERGWFSTARMPLDSYF